MPGRVFRRENHKLPSSHLSFGIHAASEGPTHELHFLFGSPQFLPLQASGNGFAQTHGGSEIGSEISSGRGSEISSGRGSESGGMKAATCARTRAASVAAASVLLRLNVLSASKLRGLLLLLFLLFLLGRVGLLLGRLEFLLEPLRLGSGLRLERRLGRGLLR